MAGKRLSLQDPKRKDKATLKVVKNFLRWSLFLLFATLIVAGIVVYRRGGDQLRAVALKVLNKQFPDAQINFDSVLLDSNRGIRIQGLSYATDDTKTNSSDSLLEVDEIYVQCPIDLKSLTNGSFAPRKISLRRPKLRARAAPQLFLEDLKKLIPTSSVENDLREIEIIDASLELVDRAGKDACVLNRFSGFQIALVRQDQISEPLPKASKTDDGKVQSIAVVPNERESKKRSRAATVEYVVENSSVKIKPSSYEETREASDSAQERSVDSRAPRRERQNVSTPAGKSESWTIKIDASNPGVQRLNVVGQYNSDGTWSMRGAVDNLDLAETLDLAQKYFAETFSFLDALQGKTSFDFQISGNADDFGSVKYEIDGTTIKCAFATNILKYPVSDVEMRYKLSNDRATVEQTLARCGLTSIKTSYRQTGALFSPQSAVLTSRLENFPLNDANILSFIGEAKNSGLFDKERSRALLNFFEYYGFSASTDVDVVLEKKSLESGWVPSKLGISVKNLDVEYSPFPYRLNNLTGRLELDADETLSISLNSAKVEGNASRGNANAETSQEDANIKVEGVFRNAFKSPQGQIDIKAVNYPVDSKLLLALPDSQREAIERLHPTGAIDVDFRSVYNSELFPEKPLRLEATIKLRDGSLRYDLFPLPISSISGSLFMRDDLWIFSDLSGKSGPATIQASGSFANGKGLREITEEFRAFAANSNAQGAQFIERPDSADSPAPIEKFANLPVPNNPSLKTDAYRFQLTADVQNFPLGEELQNALVHWDKKEDFTKINLDGKANGQIRVAYRTDLSKLTVEFDMRPTSGSTSARPEKFPFELRDIDGKFFYREGALNIDGLRARNGRTLFSANLKSRTFPDGSWVLDFADLRVDQLQPDRDLQSAAPNQASKFLAFLNLGGSFNVSGAARLSKAANKQAKINSLWDLRFTTQQAQARPGIPLDAICGSARVLGSAVEDSSPVVFGEFNLDSLYWRDLQVSNLTGPFYFNGTDLFWGREAPSIQRTPIYQNPFLKGRIDADPDFQRTEVAFPPIRPNASTARASRDLFTRAQTQNAAPGFQNKTPEENKGLATLSNVATDGRRPLVARVFDGSVVADGAVNLTGAPSYRISAGLQGGSLADASRYFAPGTKPLKGKIRAAVNLHGEGTAIQTLKGEGDMSASEAELYELPQIVKIFQILSVKEPDRAAFDSATVKFNVLGDRLELTNVLLRGDALTLFGSGWLTLKGGQKIVDMTLNSRLGNASNQIPIVSDVIGEVGDQLSQIRVEGDLKSPIIHQEAAPGVKKAWWSVFPEREPTPSDKAPVGRIRPFRDAWRKITGTDSE